MEAALKFYFRSSPPREMARDVLRHVQESGRGDAQLERQDRFTVLYLDDPDDGELVRHQFGGILDMWVDLT